MDYLNFKFILNLLFLCCILQNVSARSVPIFHNDAIDKAFAELSSNEDVVHAHYSQYTNDEPVTICWNEKTVLNFYQNGTKSGYVEYSISLETKPQENDDPVDSVRETYEILEKDSEEPRILDFVNVKQGDDLVTKKNSTSICRSDKAYSRIFTNLEGRKRIEVKLKPVVQELDMGSVKAKDSNVEVQQRLLPEDTRIPVPTSSEESIEEFENPEDFQNRQLQEEWTSNPVYIDDNADDVESSSLSPTDEGWSSTQITPSRADNEDSATTEIEATECNKKKLLKVRLGLEDDSGQLAQLEKSLEIDTDKLQTNPDDEFEDQLTQLIRAHFSDALENHNKCGGAQTTDSTEDVKFKMLEDSSEENQTEDPNHSDDEKKNPSSGDDHVDIRALTDFYDQDQNQLIHPSHSQMFSPAPENDNVYQDEDNYKLIRPSHSHLFPPVPEIEGMFQDDNNHKLIHSSHLFPHVPENEKLYHNGDSKKLIWFLNMLRPVETNKKPPFHNMGSSHLHQHAFRPNKNLFYAPQTGDNTLEMFQHYHNLNGPLQGPPVRPLFDKFGPSYPDYKSSIQIHPDTSLYENFEPKHPDLKNSVHIQPDSSLYENFGYPVFKNPVHIRPRAPPHKKISSNYGDLGGPVQFHSLTSVGNYYGMNDPAQFQPGSPPQNFFRTNYNHFADLSKVNANPWASLQNLEQRPENGKWFRKLSSKIVQGVDNLKKLFRQLSED